MEPKNEIIEQIEELIADNVELCAENAMLKDKLASYEGVQVGKQIGQDVEWGSDEHLRNMTVDVLFAEVRYWHKLSVDETEKRYEVIHDTLDLLENILGFLDANYVCERCPMRGECEKKKTMMSGCIGKEIFRVAAMRLKEKLKS